MCAVGLLALYKIPGPAKHGIRSGVVHGESGGGRQRLVSRELDALLSLTFSVDSEG